MDRKRWNFLMDNETEKLTEEERKAGWHFCFGGWDGLLVGPGMGEFEYCECRGLEVQRAAEKQEMPYHGD